MNYRERLKAFWLQSMQKMSKNWKMRVVGLSKLANNAIANFGILAIISLSKIASSLKLVVTTLILCLNENAVDRSICYTTYILKFSGVCYGNYYV